MYQQFLKVFTEKLYKSIFQTHEEAVADLLSDVGPMSYKQLPLLLYQVHRYHIYIITYHC